MNNYNEKLLLHPTDSTPNSCAFSVRHKCSSDWLTIPTDGFAASDKRLGLNRYLFGDWIHLF